MYDLICDGMYYKLVLKCTCPVFTGAVTYVTGSWKTYLLGTSKLFGKTQLKISTISSILIFFHTWIKQLLNLLAVTFHTHSFFFLGDMDDYIRPCSNFTCVGQQLTYKLGDLFRCWNG